MEESDIELGIRKYKSLPSNLNSYEHDYEHENIGILNISNNPLIKKHIEVNAIGVDTNFISEPKTKSGIIGNFVVCFKSIQNYLERKKIWHRTKENFNIVFPYILHYYTHLIFIIVFEIIFYFKYATMIEKELINSLITNIVTTLVEIYFSHNPQADKLILSEELTQAICNKYNQITNNHNDIIYENCLLGIIILIAVFSLILLVGTKLYGYKLVSSVIVDSIVLIMLLGIFEYLFFAYIILDYQIITMGEIICVAVNVAYQYMQTH